MWGENILAQSEKELIVAAAEGGNTLLPKKVMTGVTCLAAGSEHTLALKEDGGLWAWGYNSYGQLGDGTAKDSLLPQKMMDGITLIAAGDYHTLALKRRWQFMGLGGQFLRSAW